ncbi:MAG: outer membrane protein assembly factor BamA [Spirochaetia bacterium]|nr:outer membrane protein assembly factor BamA [Spirochaetia bacterium]
MVKKLFPILLLLSVLSPLFSVEIDEPWWIGKPIVEIEFVNLEQVKESDVAQVVSPLIGTNYSNESVDSVVQELLDSGKFVTIDVFPSPKTDAKEASILYFEVVETLPLGTLQFKGNKLVAKEAITKNLPLKSGELFSLEATKNAVTFIKEVYRQKGYDSVDISYTYDTNKTGTAIDVSFQIVEYDWYINKPIKGFTFNSLINADKNELEDITFPYIGKPFTQALYKEIETKFNNLLQFSLFEAEAVRGGLGNSDLFIDFTFTELPVINAITFNGNAGIKSKTMINALSLKEGDFLSLSKVNGGAEELKNLYIEKGYADALVDSSYSIDEATNTIELTYAIIEGRQSKVDQINFVGVENLSVNEVKKAVSTKVQSLFNAGNYNEATILADRGAIELTYQNNGFIDAKVVDVVYEEVVQDKPTIKKLNITFVIEEGKQWFLGAINVEGNNVFPDETFDSVITIAPGSVLNISKIQSNISNIADIYWNEGYVENTIDIKEDRDEEKNTISYTVVISEKGQARIENVIIRGLTKTKEYVLTRELTLQPGDVFSKKKYIQSAQNLFNTGLLTDVVPSISYGTQENTLVVTYTVTEGNQMNIGFGATFGGNVDGFPVSGFLSWEDSNIGGTGRDLTISTELSPDSQSANVSFADTWVGDKRWSNSLNLSFKRTNISNALRIGDGSPTTQDRESKAYPYPYTSYEAWVADGKGSPDSRYLMPYVSYKVSLGYNTGYTFLFDAGRLSIAGGPSITLNRAEFDPDIYAPYDYLVGRYQQRWELSNRLSLSLSWDGRDLINNTTKGYIVNQSIVYAGGILGGLSNYMRSSTSASGFLKLFDIPGEKPTPVVASLNTTVSFLFNQFYPIDGNFSNAWTTGISASMYEYLYIDGITIARGIEPQFYKEFLWDSSLETSIQIAQNVLWGEAFVSATAVSGDLNSLNTSPLDWYFSAGVGIRLKIPGFPLGLYLVKNARIEEGNPFTYDSGSIFSNSDAGSGLKLVLAITSTLY